MGFDSGSDEGDTFDTGAGKITLGQTAAGQQKTTGGRGESGSLGRAEAETEMYMRKFDPASPSKVGRSPTFQEASRYQFADRQTSGEGFLGTLASFLIPGAGALSTAANLYQVSQDMRNTPGATWNLTNPTGRDFGQTLGELDPATGRYSLVDAPQGSQNFGGSLIEPAGQKKTAGTTASGGGAQTAGVTSGVTPRAATGAAVTATDRSVSKSRRGGTQVAGILSSPFGDLSQAPTTKKTLLGA